jgi:hypothetical protein
MTVVALLLFRKPLTAFLDRLESFAIGKGLLEAAAAAASMQIAPRNMEVEGLKLVPGDVASHDEAAVVTHGTIENGESAKRTKEIEEAGLPPSVLLRQQRIRVDLKKIESQPDQKKVGLLVRHLALTQAEYFAERVYRLIFGSQISALRWMNTFGPATVDQVRRFYETAKSKFPDGYEGYSFDVWFDFFRSYGLVSPASNERLIITADGKYFLQWMAAEGAVEAKLL